MCPHIEAYADALERGWRAEHDYFAKVCNEFHTQISWQLADHKEPELPLPNYDSLAPQTVEIMEEEERAERHDHIEALNVRIRRWLKYHVRSLRRKIISKADTHDNSFAVLLAKLSGLVSPLKARQAYQQWMRESYDTQIASVVAERWEARAIEKDRAMNSKKPDAPFRSAVARKLFAALPDAGREAVRGRAAAEAAAAKAAYLKGLKEGPGKSPEARQRCINALGVFMTPIMKGIQEHMGLQGFLVMGRPMPKYGGEIGTMHISVGWNLSAIPITFPSWNKTRFAQDILGFTKEYLQTAYTSRECAEAALPDGASLADAWYTMEDGGGSGSCSDLDSESGSASESEEEGRRVKSKGKGKADAGDKMLRKRKRAGLTGDGAKATVPPTKKTKGAPEGDDDDEEDDEEETSEQEGARHLRETMELRAASGREYEAGRQANIRRNQVLMEELGLRAAALGLFTAKPVKAPHKPRAPAASTGILR
ncbi:hypothetical protein DFH09DRAFT_1313762 [Mycena vulgaris]|nr:hypothetical protein DFH09DRAFT_1313762 [Mycena vulgaris]